MKSNFNLFIGQRISSLRKMRKLRQEDIADSMKITRSQFSNIERGNNGTSLENMYHLTKILKCTISDIFPKENELEGFVPINKVEKKKMRIKQQIEKLNEQLLELK